MSDPDPVIRLAALRLLFRATDDRDALAAAQKDPDPLIWAEAVSRLPVSALCDRLGHNAQPVRQAAAQRLLREGRTCRSRRPFQRLSRRSAAIPSQQRSESQRPPGPVWRRPSPPLHAQSERRWSSWKRSRRLAAWCERRPSVRAPAICAGLSGLPSHAARLTAAHAEGVVITRTQGHPQTAPAARSFAPCPSCSEAVRRRGSACADA